MPLTRGLSQIGLKSVEDLIDNAFGKNSEFYVDNGAIYAILLVLARSLKILDRQVVVETPVGHVSPISASNSLNVREIKISAHKKKINDELNEGKFKEESKLSKITTAKKNIDDIKNKSKVKGPFEKSDIEQEKLLIVEKGPQTQQSDIPQSIATREQFDKLEDAVNKLRNQYDSFDESGWNNDFLEALQKDASLSDPMAVIQLSTRLEQVEKAIADMTTVLKDMVRNKSTLQIDANRRVTVISADEQLDHINFQDLKRSIISKSLLKLKASKSSLMFLSDKRSGPSYIVIRDYDWSQVNEDSKKSRSSTVIEQLDDIDDSIENEPNEYVDQQENVKDGISYNEFIYKMEVFQDHVMNFVTSKINANIINCKILIDDTTLINKKIIKICNLQDKINNLQQTIQENGNKCADMDNLFSGKILKLQDDLGTFEFRMENKIAEVADSLAKQNCNRSGEIKELTNNFAGFKKDSKNMYQKQIKFNSSLLSLSKTISDMTQTVNSLDSAKCDRAEFEEKLKCKPGSEIINTFLTKPHYGSVLSLWQKFFDDIDERIIRRNKVWQTNIDAFFKELDTTVNLFDLNALKEDINRYMTILREKVDFMIDICKTMDHVKMDSRAVGHKMPCISCDTATNQDRDKRDLKTKTPLTTSADSSFESTDSQSHSYEEEEEVCYKGTPVHHTSNWRAKNCSKYCGGKRLIDSETATKDKIAPCISIQSLQRGKKSVPTHQDVSYTEMPCLPCSVKEFCPTPLKKVHRRKKKKLPLNTIMQKRDSIGSQISKHSRQEVSINLSRSMVSGVSTPHEASELKVTDLDEYDTLLDQGHILFHN